MVSLCWVKCNTGLYCKNYKKNGYSQCRNHLKKSNFKLYIIVTFCMISLFFINPQYYIRFNPTCKNLKYYYEQYKQYVQYINNIKYEQYIISIYKMDKSYIQLYIQLYKQILINVTNIILVYFYKLKNTLF
jgi:hypothetical protein